MGSTYLTLTNKVLRRLNEVELTASTFASARGVHAQAKDAVNDAIQEINTQEWEWPFNAANGTQVLTIGELEYTWPVNFRQVDWQSFYIEKDDTIGNLTKNLPRIAKDQWQKYAREKDLDADPAEGRNIPENVFELNSGGFAVTPSPNAAYTVHYNYFVDTTIGDTYDATTTIPTKYDYVIVNRALFYMRGFLEDAGAADQMNATYEKNIRQMTRALIPTDPYAYGTMIERSSTNNGYYWGE